MLEKLSIQNIGLVEKADIDFGSALTAFTGETGAGKSMLLSSLLILFGAKVGAHTIRHGETRAEVCAQWNIENMQHVKAWLGEKSLECEDVLVLRCVLQHGKKKQCFIQGTLVSSVQLGECMNVLCEIHAQHEHQNLFKSREQCKILDAYAGISAKQEQFSKDLLTYRKKKEQWRKLCESEEQAKQEMEYLRFAVNEIEEAQMSHGEDVRVNEELIIQSNAQDIARLLSQAQRSVRTESEEETSMYSLYNTLVEALRNLQKYNARTADTIKRIDSAMVEISDAVDEINALYGNKADEQRFDIPALEERLATIEILKKKYGGSLESVFSFLHEARAKLTTEEHLHQNKEGMFEELREESVRLMQEADALHEARVEAAQAFSQQVNEVLHILAMNTADFCVAVPDLEKERRTLNPLGYDDVSFLIRSNTGEPYMPIAKGASGGELSRIMLAIRVVGKSEARIQTLILDEIDAGIGGKTAVQVAHYLAKLAHKTQIICVTHLPVIAAAAKLHYYVYKKGEKGRTCVLVEPIGEDVRLQEIARMLVGNEHDVLAHNQAQSLLQSFHDYAGAHLSVMDVPNSNAIEIFHE